MKTVNKLLQELSEDGLELLTDAKREEKYAIMQQILIESIDAYNKIAPLRFDYDALVSLKAIISQILLRAQARDQIEPVARHLVGATLAMRFPHLKINNNGERFALKQSPRLGDFFIGDTVFHVTDSFTKILIEKCHRNLQEGSAVFLIVLASRLGQAKVLLELAHLDNKIALESVESFVGQNLSELAGFDTNKYAETLGDLLREYNRRVNEAETDSSLQVEIPVALGGQER